MTVAGLGASSVDYVYLVPEIPAAGARDKLQISSHFVSSGGQVANTLAACAALGLPARYLGPSGADLNASRVRDELSARGVDVSRVIVRQAANQFAVILVDQRSGERLVLWDRDTRLALPPRDFDPALLDGASLLHVDDVDEEASIAAANAATARGLTVTSDLDRVTPRTPELVASVTVPVFAAHVPEALTGERDPERALLALRQRHHGLLCVTLGKRGAVALEGDRILHSPGFAVQALDTTGAGDVFRAGLIFGLLNGWAAERALRFANAAAAASCTKLGAMASVPSLADVESLLRESA